MALINKWRGDFIGGSDDSLLLLDYLEQKGKSVESLELNNILEDLHLTAPLKEKTIASADLYWKEEGSSFEPHFDMAIDVIMDLSVIVLESLKQKEISLSDFDDSYSASFSIESRPKELVSLMDALNDFSANPFAYELSQFMEEEDLQELCKQCTEVSESLKEFTV